MVRPLVVGLRALVAAIAALGLCGLTACGSTPQTIGTSPSPSASPSSSSSALTVKPVATPGAGALASGPWISGPEPKARLGQPLVLTAAGGVKLQVTPLSFRSFGASSELADGLNWHDVVGVRVRLQNLATTTYRLPRTVMNTDFLIDTKGRVYGMPNEIPESGLVTVVIPAGESQSGWLFFQARPGVRALSVQYSAFSYDGQLGDTGAWRLN